MKQPATNHSCCSTTHEVTPTIANSTNRAVVSYEVTAMNIQERIDLQYMCQAYELAVQGKVSCYPNPAVGCVLVKDGRVIGQGYHQYAGQGHAEVNAVAVVKQTYPESWQQLLQGATAYVTLEPCAHYGRTPPCALMLASHKLARVVIGQSDATDKVNGKGVQILQEAGIQVDFCSYDSIAKLNRDFFVLQGSSEFTQPYIRLKVGASLDGRTALPNGASKWITNAQSRSYVQALRLHSDAIMCTARTVIMDQARYNVRYDELPAPILQFLAPEQVEQPMVIIVDNSQQLTGNEAIFAPSEWQRTIVIVSNQPHRLASSIHTTRVTSQEVTIQATTLQAVTPLYTPTIVFQHQFDSHQRDDMVALLQWLYQEYQVRDLLVEAGSSFTSAMLSYQLAQELHYFIAPKILGQGNMALHTQQQFTLIADTIVLELAYQQRLGDDLYLVYHFANS